MHWQRELRSVVSALINRGRAVVSRQERSELRSETPVGSAPPGPTFDPDSLLRQVDDLRDEVTRLRAVLAGGGEAEAVTGPIFVGGTGRSGTWALGILLGKHPDVACINREMRFHAAPPGFPSVLDGRTSLTELAKRIRKDHNTESGPFRNLPYVASWAQIRSAEKSLKALAEHDVRAGLRTYAHTLLDAFAVGRGARTWVETSPDNAAAAAVLHKVFPTAKVVHSVRDGRDVAASVVTKKWGPNDYEEGLTWWVDRLLKADRAARDADPTRLHIVQLESLVHAARDAEFDRLMDFLGIEQRGKVRKHFDTKMQAENAHVGRWRSEVGEARIAEIDEAYRTLYRQLAAEGVQCLPLHPDAVDEIARTQAARAPA